jgi:hypothetical protein
MVVGNQFALQYALSGPQSGSSIVARKPIHWQE